VLWLRWVHHLICSKEHLPEANHVQERIIDTGWRQVVGDQAVTLHAAPPGSAVYADSAPVIELKLQGSILELRPIGNTRLHLQTLGSRELTRLRGKADIPQAGLSYGLHLGDITQTHDLWRFKW
jgi:hypothetical protein